MTPSSTSLFELTEHMALYLLELCLGYVPPLRTARPDVDVRHDRHGLSWVRHPATGWPSSAQPTVLMHPMSVEVTAPCIESARVLGIVASLAAVSVAGAQQRRTASPGGNSIELPNIPADPRHPFAGAWVGRLMMDNDTIPIAMIIDVADGKYTGSTVWPDGGRAPHNNTATSGQTITWQQTNSGGGLWHYELELLRPATRLSAPWSCATRQVFHPRCRRVSMS